MVRSLLPPRKYLILSAALLLTAGCSLGLARGGTVGELPEAWFNAVAQLVATLVGAGIATGVSWHFAREAKIDQDQSSVMYAMQKLMSITNNLFSMVTLFDETLSQANEVGLTAQPVSTRLRPTVSVPPDEVFEATDLQAFFTHGASELANDLILLAQRHNAFLATLRMYNTLQIEHRKRLRELMDAGAQTTPPSMEFERKELEVLALSLIKVGREQLAFAHAQASHFNSASTKIARGRPRVVIEVDHEKEAGFKPTDR